MVQIELTKLTLWKPSSEGATHTSHLSLALSCIMFSAVPSGRSVWMA